MATATKKIETPLMGKTPQAAVLVALDDGHGTETAGKRSPAFSDGGVLKENEFNSKTADYLKEALERCGFDVLMVAPEETDTALATRVQRANAAKADIYISIHANAYGTNWNTANGVETWIYGGIKNQSQTYRFAECIHEALVSGSGRKDRGIKRSSELYVLKATTMHAVLVECGFMTNREECELLKLDSYRRKCAESICKGVCAFYKAQYKQPENMPEERFNNLREIPSWGQPLISEMVMYKCFANEHRMDLSEDMIRTMELMDRLWKAREARK